MKTKRLFITVLAWVFLASQGLVYAQSSAPADQAGFVAAVRGDVQIVRGDEKLKASIGKLVMTGDVLTTGAKSRLKVLLSDDSILALGSNSQLEVAEHHFKPGSARTTRLNLNKGRIRAMVQKVVAGGKADFKIRTGTAVAGVRGTEFALSSEGEDMRLVTFSGSVEWKGAQGEPVLVAAGEGSCLKEGLASRPESLASAELTAIRNETDTEQAPTALAWNLSPARAIRGRASRGVGQTTEAGSAMDTGQVPDSSAVGALQRNSGKVVVPEVNEIVGAWGSQFYGTSLDGSPPELFDGEYLGGWRLDPVDAFSGNFVLRINITRGRAR